MGALGSNPTLLILLIGMAALAGVGSLAIMLADAPGQRRAKRRFDRLRRRLIAPSAADRIASIRMADTKTGGSVLDRLAQRLLPRPAALRLRLERSGRKISVGAYCLLNIAVAIVAWLGLGEIGIGDPIAPLLALGAGIGLPHMMVGRWVNQRTNRFVMMFPEAIDLITRGVRSGLPVSAQFAIVANEIVGPVGQEFRKIADSLRFTQSVDAALDEAALRIGVPEFRYFMICLAIQRETGGNLAETLGNLSDVLRRRQQMKMKIKAMSSEAKASALILGGLPFIVAGILKLTNPDYIAMLFTDPRGHVLGAAALFSEFVGIAVMSKMIKIDV